MEIAKDLRLTFPIRYAEDGEGVLQPVVWAYHTSISREVFEANYRIISSAHLAIWEQGQPFVLNSGARVATLEVQTAARKEALKLGLEITGDPASPLLLEIKRLTLVLVPGVQGYESLPVDIALKRGAIDDEDWREAESGLVFFTCGLWMSSRRQREATATGLSRLLGGSITSSSLTEFAASLQTPTTAAPSIVALSSVPS